MSITFFPLSNSPLINVLDIASLDSLPSLPTTIMSLSFWYRSLQDLAIKSIDSSVSSFL